MASPVTYSIYGLDRPGLTIKQTEYVLRAPSVLWHHKEIEEVMVKDSIIIFNINGYELFS